MVYGRLAAFCGNGQQIGKKLCWLSDDLNVRTIMNIAAVPRIPTEEAAEGQAYAKAMPRMRPTRICFTSEP